MIALVIGGVIDISGFPYECVVSGSNPNSPLYSNAPGISDSGKYDFSIKMTTRFIDVF